MVFLVYLVKSRNVNPKNRVRFPKTPKLYNWEDNDGLFTCFGCRRLQVRVLFLRLKAGMTEWHTRLIQNQHFELFLYQLEQWCTWCARLFEEQEGTVQFGSVPQINYIRRITAQLVLNICFSNKRSLHNNIKQVLLRVSVQHHCGKQYWEVFCFTMQLDLEVLMVFQKIVTLYRSWVRIPLAAMRQFSWVRTIEGNAGSNPATNLGLVLTAACRLTDSKSVFQRTFTLKKNDTKKTDLSLSVKK